MVLADTDAVDADLIGKHRLSEHMPEDRRMGHRLAVLIGRHVAERVDPELNRVCHESFRS